MSEQLRRSQRQEARVAKRTGGSLNAGSGNGWQRKADVRVGGSHDPRYLYEMKRTDNKKSISVKVDDLETLRKQAWADSRTPVFHIEIDNKRYVILLEDDFMDLTTHHPSENPI